MSETTIVEKVEEILKEASSGITHEGKVLLAALEGLLSHHKAVANGLPAPEIPASDASPAAATPNA